MEKNSANSLSKLNRMGEAPVGRLLLSMSWPAILSMSIGALYNIVDSIFVAMISQEALTAVSLVMPFQVLIIAVGVGSGVGVNSLIARRLGEKKYEEANKAAGTTVKIAFFNYCIFLLCGLFVTEPFLKLYTNDPVVLEAGIIYMRIICCLSLSFLMQLGFEKVMQSTGNMIGPMTMAISGAIVNLVLDPILIFGLLGAPKLGVAGAAIATVMGQTVAFFIGIYIFKTKESPIEVKWRGVKIDWKIVKEIYAVGLPSIIMQAISSAMLIIYNSIIAASAVAVAVLGVYFKLQSLVFMPVFGLTQGALPIMGYNYGARNKDRLMKVFKFALIASTVYLCLCTLVFELFPDFLLSLFSANEEMMEIGIPAFKIIGLSFLMASLDVIGSTFFQATGHGLYSLFGSLVRQFVGILPIAWFLYNQVGIKASWASFPLAEILGFTYGLIMMIVLYRKEISKL